jgi:hypothetical protein
MRFLSLLILFGAAWVSMAGRPAGSVGKDVTWAGSGGVGIARATGDIPVDSMPTPPSNPKQLFYLQRTPNANTIVCELNDDKDGVANPDAPIHVYWLRYTEQQHGQRAELNYIQRHYAYGISANQIGPDKYELHFVSYKKYAMYLEKAADHKYHVFAQINGQVAILNRIFVSIHGGSFWLPHVDYVELKGIDPATGRVVTGRINVS